MIILFLRRLVFTLSAATFLGGGFLFAAEGQSTQSSLNDGYSLFYHFCDQEKDLGLLLWVKTTPPDIADYAKRIAATAKDDMAILTRFRASDSSLRLDKVSLPSFEINVRLSMDADRKQQLIWGSSGPAFAQAMIMTQSEATNYGLHVAKILAQTEPDADRARTMQRIFEKWTALHAEAYRLGK